MTQPQGTQRIEPAIEKPHPVGNGTQKLYRFDNGYGASVVQFTLPALSGFHFESDGSYGSSAGLWELAVIKWSGEEYHLTYETPITEDVIGHLDLDEIEEYLIRIRDLPAVSA